MIIGIDALNIRSGGGVTHLVELLASFSPERINIKKVFIWSNDETLAKISDRVWLVKINPLKSNQSLFHRVWWQKFKLASAVRAVECDVLFVPGGSYAGNFCPVVIMSQNLLPFEWSELARYGFSFLTLKFILLRFIQTKSFCRADGVIFLTEYARKIVTNVAGTLHGTSVVIPHGLNPRFQIEPRAQLSISEYGLSNPYRILYVSVIDVYKHQLHVVEAVYKLRQEGMPVVLDLVGPAYAPALKRLNHIISIFDHDRIWINYHGSVPYSNLHSIYKNADLGIFASSCENMPIILLETMASGLPVACSNRGPMPEVLGETGLYFDPENSTEIAHTIRRYINSAKLRNEKSQASFARSQQYSWKSCADYTFAYLVNIANNFCKK